MEKLTVLKRILIISYFFPPCNLTASQRVWGWTQYLHQHGFYPTVITRNWENEIKTEKDIALKAGNEIIYKKENHFEVYYLPHKPNLRDKLLISGKFPIIRKLLTIIELIGQNYSLKLLSYSKFYHKAIKLHKKHKFKGLIISGNPFHQFYLGYKFHKKTQTPWIADYRDDWTTDELNIPKSVITKLIRSIDRTKEKKWVGSASRISSVSPYYTQKISNLTKVLGSVLYNGFFEEEYIDNSTPILKNEFRLLYNGTLYPSQSIEPFFNGVKSIISQLKQQGVAVKIQFPGVLYKPDQGERIKKLMNGFEKNIELTNRLPREKVLQMQKEAHVLLMFAHKDIKGIPSSKIYEYLGYKKPILLCPGDNDILEEIIQTTNSGMVCNNDQNACLKTLEIFELYKSNTVNQYFKFKNDDFTRKSQTQKLAKLIDQIIS